MRILATVLADVVIETGHGFYLAPSNIDLAGAEVELKQLLAADCHWHSSGNFFIKVQYRRLTSHQDPFIYSICQ